MAITQLNAPMPTSGAIHVRTRLAGNFTILANRLARRPGSAVTVGVALYINSMPDGTPVTIAALQKHFTEGETVISRALRELEADGWLERRLFRGSDGRLRTRTLIYALPELADPDGAAEATQPKPSCVETATSLPSPRTEQPEPRPAASTASQAEPGERTDPPPAPAPSVEHMAQPEPRAQTPAQPDPEPFAPASRQARTILAELGAVDPRLTLSRREIDRLAPGVDAWLASGVRPARITGTLTADLPASFRSRPAAILAWRLAELRPAPSPEPPPPSVPVAPLRNCPECDRAHRSHTPGLCPFCAHERRHGHPQSDAVEAG
ncbi:hypothetical protein RM572_12065 [Streptomyces sp. DSM 42041]|uniref:Helix-turn-helix domain-containing protein n=1 Tax=Streptomyces hazeniae TaxID=3075538 RepID=A0ABU2NR95_9ACTN|nr:hypothetical protein [Streptomyces sp. DSM 42041]MDT0379500.1 hypothetical protein [Streptomyces sp. DSM 42041]